VFAVLREEVAEDVVGRAQAFLGRAGGGGGGEGTVVGEAAGDKDVRGRRRRVSPSHGRGGEGAVQELLREAPAKGEEIMKTKKCAVCGREKFKIRARGMCSSCYCRAWYRANLSPDYESWEDQERRGAVAVLKPRYSPGTKRKCGGCGGVYWHGQSGSAAGLCSLCYQRRRRAARQGRAETKT